MYGAAIYRLNLKITFNRKSQNTNLHRSWIFNYAEEEIVFRIDHFPASSSIQIIFALKLLKERWNIEISVDQRSTNRQVIKIHCLSFKEHTTVRDIYHADLVKVSLEIVMSS